MAAFDASSLSRFQRIFRGREHVYGQTELTPTGEKKSSWTVHKAPGKAQWEHHLTGSGPGLGIGASTSENQCYFGVLDYDKDDLEPEELRALAVAVDAGKLPLVVCRSKSGGAHLFAFLTDPVPAKVMVAKMREFAAFLGIARRGDWAGRLAGQPIEVFPKSAKLSDKDDGNWINLPYYKAESTARYAVTPEGARLDLDEFLDYVEEKQITSTEFELAEPHTIFKQGAPCLSKVHQEGVVDGSRNQALYNFGIYFKLANPDGWKEDLAEYNREHVDPPIKDRELKAIAKSLEHNDYNYKCDDLPIQPHCDKVACKKQTFGIMAIKKKLQRNSMPLVEDLRRVETDPPQWLLNVSGKEISLATDDLMLIPRFRKSVMNKCSLIFPLMKQGDWDQILGELLQKVTVIEAPEDAGVIGQFKYHLADFMLRRKNSQSMDDLLNGLPVEEGSMVYFRGNDFIAFLERKKFKDYTIPEVHMALRNLGCGHTKKDAGGTQVRVWMIPVPHDGSEQSEDFTERVLTDPEM